MMCMAGSLFAQELSIKVDERGKSGYVNAAGVEVVPCKYDVTYPFENGFGMVMKGDKYGLVDKDGNEVVPLKWSEIKYDAKNNLYFVKAGNKYGLLKANGEELVKAQYSYISAFNCYGKALVAAGGKLTASTQQKGKSFLLAAKYGVLNVDGSLAIPVKYKGLYEFATPVATNTVGAGTQARLRTYYIGDTLTTDCQYVGFDSKGWTSLNAGLLDGQGNILLKPKMAQYLFLPHNGIARYYTYVKKFKNFEVGYINVQTQNKKAVLNTSSDKTDFSESTDYMDEIAAYAKNGVWNFIDRNLATVKSGYKSLSKGTNCGLWCGWTSDGKCEFFDKEGKPLLEGTNYTRVIFPTSKESIDKQYIAVKNQEKWGLIDRDNKVYIPFEYEQMSGCYYGWVPVKKDGKWGMQSVKNEVVVPAKFDDISIPHKQNASALYVQKADKLWYVYNLSKAQTMGRGYKTTGVFVDDIAWARTSDMQVKNNDVYRSLSPDANINVENFGFIIDNEGRELITEPMPISCIGEIREVVLKKGKRALTQNETKNLLLKLSVGNRHYALDSKIEEANWDY